MPDTGETAEQLIEEGHWVLLVKEGGKVPAYRFKDTPPLTREEMRRRFRRGMNLAIRLPGLVALDADDEQARRRLHELPESPITQLSPSNRYCFPLTCEGENIR